MRIKKAVVAILCLALIVPTIFTTVFSAGEKPFVNDLQFRLATDNSGVFVDYYVTTGSESTKGLSLTYIYDSDVFKLMNNDSTSEVSFTASNDAITSAERVNVTSVGFMINNLVAHVPTSDTTLRSVKVSRASLSPIQFASPTLVSSVFLKFQDGKSIDDVSAKTLRLADATVADELHSSTTYVVSISDASNVEYKFGDKNNPTTGNSSELLTPTATPTNFTFSLEEYSGTQAVAPTVSTKKGAAVTLTAQTVTDETVEYAYTSTNVEADALATTWQDSNVFNITTPGDYYFWARVKATSTHKAGVAQVSAMTTVYGAPTLSYSNVPTSADINTAFTLVPSAANGATAGSVASGYALKSGSPALPAGLALDATNGSITGTATALTSAPVTVTVVYTDKEGQTAEANVTIPEITGATTAIALALADDSALPLTGLNYGSADFTLKATPATSGTASENFTWTASDDTAVSITETTEGQATVKILKPVTGLTIKVDYVSNTHSGTVTSQPFTFGKATVTLAATAENKSFDDNFAASITGATISGQVTGDTAAEIDLNSTTGTGAFTTKYVADGIDVTIDANQFSLTGTKADYYTLAALPTLSANIRTATQTLTTNYDTVAKAFNLLRTNGSVAYSALVGNAMGTVSGTIDGTAPTGVSTDGTTITTTTATLDETFTVSVTAAAHNVDGAGADEYSAAPSTTVHIILKDKITDTTSMTVNLTDFTFGDTLPTATFVDPTTNNEYLTAATFMYEGVAPTVYASNSNAPTAAGTYKVTATKQSDTHLFIAEDNFTIAPKNISSATITLGATALTYTGSELTRDFSVADGSTPLALTTDYTVDGTSNKATNAGDYTLTINGAGNYTGSKNITFNIAKLSITPAAANVSKVFDGNNKATATSVDFTGLVGSLTYGTDYTATGTYTTGINVGTGLDVSLTVTLQNTAAANNFTLSTNALTISTGSISAQPKADVATEMLILWNNEDPQTINFSKYIPANAGSSDILDPPGIVVNDTDMLLDSSTSDVANKSIEYQLVSGLDKILDKDKTVTFTATIDSLNYDNYDVVVTVKITDYIAPPTPPVPPMSFADETNGKIVSFSNGSTITLTFPMEYADYAGIWFDGKAVNLDDIGSIRPGSIIVTLKPSFTSTLSNGKHTVHVISKNGSMGYAEFYIGGHTNPQTSAK